MRREAAGKRKQPTIEGERKSEAPDLGLAVWQNEAHRKNYDDLSLTQRKRKGTDPTFPIWGSNP